MKPGTTRRRPVRATVVLVRRYLPTALAVAGVVALLDLTPSLDGARGSPSRDAPAPVPPATAPVTTAPAGATTTTGRRPGH